MNHNNYKIAIKIVMKKVINQSKILWQNNHKISKFCNNNKHLNHLKNKIYSSSQIKIIQPYYKKISNKIKLNKMFLLQIIKMINLKIKIKIKILLQSYLIIQIAIIIK